MKRSLPAVMCIAALLPFASSALAADEGAQISNYVSFGLGTGIMSDGELNGGGTNADIGYDDFQIDLVAAYGWKGTIKDQWGWRAEAEFGWQWSRLDDVHAGGASVSVDGDAHQLALGGNGYIDWNFAKDWSAYVGVGVGGNWTTIDLSVPGTSLDSDGFGYHFQTMLGAAWKVPDSKISVFTEYRYIHPVNDTEGNTGGTNFEMSNGPSHNLIAGVRFDL